jgi:hypothetical protein
MNVTILGVAVSYFPDYTPTSTLWKVHLRDAFRMVTLAGTECFVKRFASKPRAWDFMVASKGKRQTGLPIVYDAKSAREEGKIVYYLFLEKIEGDTLHDFMKSKTRAKASATLMGRALAAAFRTIHSQGYWHADFCAKNIMVTTTGRRFVVIDLDSLEPISTQPTPTPNEPGYIPDQELAIYALTYVKEYVSPAIRSFAAIPGPALNLLQLVFLLDKLTYFVNVLKPKGIKFRELAAFQELPHIVHRYLGAYTDQLARRILDRVADSEMVISQPTFFEKELPGIVSSQQSTQAAPLVAARPISPTKPAIIVFTASELFVSRGEKTRLTWEVQGVSSAHITNIGAVSSKGSKVFDANDFKGDVIFELTAGSAPVRQRVAVHFFDPVISAPSPNLSASSPYKPPVAPAAPRAATPSPTPPAPKAPAPPPPTASIAFFRASSYSVSAGEQIVISWQVAGAASVYISNIGTVPAAGAKFFDDDAFSGRVEFVLTAGSPAIKSSFSVAFPPVAVSAAKSVATTPQTGVPSTPPPVPPVKPAAALSTPPAPKPTIALPLQSVRPTPYVSARPVLQPAQASKSKSSSWKTFLLYFVLVVGCLAVAASMSGKLAFVPNQLKGLQQFDKGQYDSSFINLVSFRDDTSHRFATQYNLAYMYDTGRGTPNDDTLAVKLYKQCLTSTTPEVVSKSLYALGCCSLLGEGGSRDVDKAKRYFSLAANLYHNGKALIQLNKLSQARLANAPTHKLPKLASPAESSLPVKVIAFEPIVETVSDAANNVIVKRVVQLENSTRVDFIYTGYLKGGHQMYLNPPGDPEAIQIECNNASYSLLKVSNISDSKDRMSTVYPGHPRYFSAYFEKIPADVAKLDIVEGGELGFAFYGVNLSTESP